MFDMDAGQEHLLGDRGRANRQADLIQECGNLIREGTQEGTGHRIPRLIISLMKHNPGFLALVNDAKSRVKEIDIEGYKKMRTANEPHVLVDTREESEFAAGHVAGAVHLSKGIIERDIETKVPDKSAKLVLYCGGGFRSALVADNLQKMGYLDAISLDGGWRALKESGLPLE
jgi:rhodanese-related sulfurtransferase